MCCLDSWDRLAMNDCPASYLSNRSVPWADQKAHRVRPPCISASSGQFPSWCNTMTYRQSRSLPCPWLFLRYWVNHQVFELKFVTAQSKLEFPENNEETEMLIFGTVSLHHLCFNTIPGLFSFGFCSDCRVFLPSEAPWPAWLYWSP